MDRRSFIQLTAVGGTSAALAGCGNPEHQILRFIPDEEHVPGVAEWKPSLCPLCRSGCGILVRVMEGDAEVVRGGQAGVMRMGLAKKLEGHPAHPISQGALCVRGQAAIQITYHPDRIRQPLRRVGPRGSGQFEPASWDVALGVLASELDRIRRAQNGRALAFLKRPRPSRRDELVDLFLERFGAPPAVAFELFTDDVLRRANLISFGREQLPTFDLAEARTVVCFGADFLGTWNSPVAQSAAYGRLRQGRSGIRGRLVQIEARLSQTGANADEWIPIRPGTEGALALGLAHVLLASGLRPSAEGARAVAAIEGWSGGLREHTPADVERQTGIPAARIERLARDLVDGRPAVAIVGGPALAHTNGLATALAVNALNALVGSVGEPGGLAFMPRFPATESSRPPARPPASVDKLAASLLGANPSPVEVLLVDDGVNPVFAAPPAWRVREALLRVPFIASFGSFLDETSSLADWILPDHSFLESWVESRPESGASVAVATIARPVVRPLHDTRAMPDVLLDVAARLEQPLDLPWKTFEEMLAAAYGSLPSTPESDGWSAALKQGGWWGPPEQLEPKGRPRQAAADERRARPFAPAAPQFDGDPADYSFHFLPYASQAFLDGSLAHLPWLQELPDVVTTAMWSSWVEVNPQTAARLGIAQGDIVEIASTQGSVRAPAVLFPGIAPDVVAMPVGQGHQTFTRYASGRGVNPMRILAPMADAETGAFAWAATRVRIRRISGPTGELVLFAGEMRERPDERR